MNSRKGLIAPGQLGTTNYGIFHGIDTTLNYIALSCTDAEEIQNLVLDPHLSLGSYTHYFWHCAGVQQDALVISSSCSVFSPSDFTHTPPRIIWTPISTSTWSSIRNRTQLEAFRQNLILRGTCSSQLFIRVINDPAARMDVPAFCGRDWVRRPSPVSSRSDLESESFTLIMLSLIMSDNFPNTSLYYGGTIPPANCYPPPMGFSISLLGADVDDGLLRELVLVTGSGGFNFITCTGSVTNKLSFEFYFQPFTLELWIGMAITFLAVLFAFISISVVRKVERAPHELWFFIYGTILDNCPPVRSKLEGQWIFRYVLCPFLLAIVVLNNAYRGIVTTELTALNWISETRAVC